MKAKKLISLGLASILCASLISGCNGAKNNKTIPETELVSGNTYAFVAKDMQNQYMQKVYEGFSKACNEIGAHSLYKAPQAATAEKQIEIINELIEEEVDGIAIAANDADALEETLIAAMNAGINVISLDSAANANSRQVHIQQANPEKIGRGLIQAAYDILGGKGGIAILSATENTPNQNLWISWMKRELEENAGKYADMPLVKIVYGDDNPTKSASETRALLNDSSIKIIIAPTTIGMAAAAKVLQDNHSPIKLTGLGLPSDMAPYIIDDTCPWMYLWNPIDIGYLAAYTTDALTEGKITGEEGGTFSAGDLGEKSVTAAADGGTEVLLGDAFKFDYTNINEWKLVY